MKIRLAKIKDYEQLMKLYNQFTKHTYYVDHTHDSFKKVLTSSSDFIYVVEDKNNIIGFASFSIRNIVRFPSPIAQLEELFVVPEYRNKGIGKKLIEMAENKAKVLHCYRVYIESASDRTVAHQVYEKLGYKNDGYYFKKDL